MVAGALIFDTVVGIVIAFGWAGPYIAATVYEAFVDWAILKRVGSKTHTLMKSESRWQLTELERSALAVTLVRALDADAEGPDGESIADVVKTELKQSFTACIFLKQSCLQLGPFGVHVGVPMVFYVAASIYALIDAQACLGDNDTAHSIAFGLWYYTIILIAIAISMVLSAGAAHIAKVAVVRRNLGYKDYRLRWICERRWELCRWSQKLLPNDDEGRYYTEIFEQHDGLPSAAIAAVVLVVPLALAFAVAYLTPEIGLSCRSATVLAYAVSQVLLILL